MGDKVNDSKNVGLLYSGILSLVCGVALNNTSADYHTVAILLNTAGVGAGVKYFWGWNKFDRIFRNTNLGVANKYYPILKSKKEKEYSTEYKFTLPTGLSTEDINKKKTAIEEHFGKKVNVEYINKGLFIIEEYHGGLQQFYKYEPVDIKGNIPIYVGKKDRCKTISFDLASGTEPHMMLGGNTGCGKSTALRSILTNIILTTKNVNIHLVDMKHGVELGLFEMCACVKSFARNLAEAERVLNRLCNELERRYNLFDQTGVNDIQLYNKSHRNNPLPFELLVIDEMIDFKKRTEILDKLEVIGAKARACGIHMILSTQRPDKDIVEGLIKNNISTILGLRTVNGVNSKIIIDEHGLETLEGKGDGILLYKGNKTRIQTPDLSYDDAKVLLKPTYIERKKTIEVINPEDIEVVNNNDIDVDDYDNWEVFQ